MGSLQSDIPNSQPISNDIQEETDSEDEFNLVDYFRVFWKRKYFIVLGPVLPALFIGLIPFFLPRKFKVTYLHDVKGRNIYDVSN